MKHQTPEEMWKEYRDACYKDKEIPKIQEAETRQAFFAGLLAAATAFAHAADSGDEEQGMKVIGQFMQAVTTAIRDRIFERQSRQ